MMNPLFRHRPALNRLRILCLFSVVSASPWFIPLAHAGDWYQWRGPEQNGVAREKDLPEKWSPNPKAQNSNLIWRQPYGGRTVPIVMNGRIYFINGAGEGVNEQERVMCLDAQKGELIWEQKFNVWHTDIVTARLGWTNLAGDPNTGNIYAQGTQGLLDNAVVLHGAGTNCVFLLGNAEEDEGPKA